LREPDFGRAAPAFTEALKKAPARRMKGGGWSPKPPPPWPPPPNA